jgi:hypothetical protein
LSFNEGGGSEELTQSSATIYKAELTYQDAAIELYIFSEYDQESIDDTVRDSILDYLEDDATRIQNILNDAELEIEVDTPLQDVDSSFSRLSGFRLYRQVGDGDPIMICDIEEPSEMPENTIQGIRDAILRLSGMQK